MKKQIVLGVSAGIAAYKSADLIRQLKKAGHEVRVVMTKGATKFISTLTLQTLSGHRVHEDLFDPETESAMSHIELAKWADLLLVAPATAHVMAKFAHGLADDLLSTLYLATEAPVVLAPAMNRVMWQHAATQANLKILTKRGVQIIGPAEGEQACGDVGLGRMVEPLEVAKKI